LSRLRSDGTLCPPYGRFYSTLRQHLSHPRQTPPKPIHYNTSLPISDTRRLCSITHQTQNYNQLHAVMMQGSPADGTLTVSLRTPVVGILTANLWKGLAAPAVRDLTGTAVSIPVAQLTARGDHQPPDAQSPRTARALY